MKFLKFIFPLLLLFAVSASAQSRFYTRNVNEQFSRSITTTGNTATVIDSFNLAAREAGTIEIKVLAYTEDSTGVYAASKTYRYQRRNGTTTVTAAAIDSAQTATADISGVSVFVLPTASGKLSVRVTGLSSRTIRWTSISKMYFRRTD